MPLIFRQRDCTLREDMDAPDCDPIALERTYRYFVHINRTLSQWPRFFKKYILPLCRDRERPYTLLDIGSGGGDIALLLDLLARQHGISMQITAIDPDPRAHAYISKLELPPTLTAACCRLCDLKETGAKFDFIISNHVLHHLSDAEVVALCADARAMATQRVIFNDLVRSESAWFLFAIGTWGRFPRSFIRADGLKSLRRAFVPAELRELLPEPWRVERRFPFRLVAVSP